MNDQMLPIGNKIPTRIKVLNLDYRIDWKDAFDMDDAGTCCTRTQVIEIASNQKPEALLETFVHEVIHAIWDAMDMGEAEPEEVVATRLGKGFCTVLRDNPGLVRNLLKTCACQGVQ